MLRSLHLSPDALPQEKYQFKPLEGSSHAWALRCASACLAERSGARVLDIGAGGGGMGRALRPLGPESLTAIEIDPTTRTQLAESYDDVHASIGEVAGRTFDLVLLLDVLEHMPNPEEFLQHLSPLLAPGARVIISVPNVAHWSVRLPLFFLGSFEPTSRGILDRTHLQFFTRARFHDLSKAISAGIVEQSSASIEPIELIFPWLATQGWYASLSRLRVRLAELLPGLFAYQHLMLVRVAEE
jgi:2-polyprenyl-3-methyl-5-hydroxy-6-metoxy-1,4-benzoquinol methylase